MASKKICHFQKFILYYFRLIHYCDFEPSSIFSCQFTRTFYFYFQGASRKRSFCSCILKIKTKDTCKIPQKKFEITEVFQMEVRKDGLYMNIKTALILTILERNVSIWKKRKKEFKHRTGQQIIYQPLILTGIFSLLMM